MDKANLVERVMANEKVATALEVERSKATNSIREAHAKFNELSDNQNKELNEALGESYTLGFMDGLNGGLDVGVVAVDAQQATSDRQLAWRGFVSSLCATVMAPALFGLVKEPLFALFATALVVTGCFWVADLVGRFMYKKIVMKQ
jgi:Flp pilus assembly protein TadB